MLIIAKEDSFSIENQYFNFFNPTIMEIRKFGLMFVLTYKLS